MFLLLAQTDVAGTLLSQGNIVAFFLFLILSAIGVALKVLRDDFKEKWKTEREDRLAAARLEREDRLREFDAQRSSQERWYAQIDGLNTRVDKIYLIVALAYPDQARAIDKAFSKE